jgi:hypothetical protein
LCARSISIGSFSCALGCVAVAEADVEGRAVEAADVVVPGTDVVVAAAVVGTADAATSAPRGAVTNA